MYGDPDYDHVHQKLKKVGVPLKLLHEEYADRCERNGEIPMGKTKFNEGGMPNTRLPTGLRTTCSTNPVSGQK